MPRKEYDAALIHGYGYNNPINTRGERRPLRPSIRGHLPISAACHLSHLKDSSIEVHNYVFSGAPLFGQETPLSKTNATELQRRLNIPDENVFVETTAHTTSQELKNFRNIAEQMGWENLLDLSVERHKRRVTELIRRLFKGRDITIDYMNAEDILENLSSERNSERYRKVIKKIHWSLGELKFGIYELINYGVTLLHGEGITERISRFFRPRIT